MSNCEQLFEKQVSQMTRSADEYILSALTMTPDERKELKKAMSAANALANIIKLCDTNNNN